MTFAYPPRNGPTKSPRVNLNPRSKPKTLVAPRQPALRIIQAWTRLEMGWSTLAAYQRLAVLRIPPCAVQRLSLRLRFFLWVQSR